MFYNIMDNTDIFYKAGSKTGDEYSENRVNKNTESILNTCDINRKIMDIHNTLLDSEYIAPIRKYKLQKGGKGKKVITSTSSPNINSSSTTINTPQTTTSHETTSYTETSINFPSTLSEDEITQCSNLKQLPYSTDDSTITNTSDENY